MNRPPALLSLEQLDLFAAPPAPAPLPLPVVTNGRGPRHQPQGDVYDLNEFFATINRTVFKNGLAPCVMRWSRNRWKSTLGLCDVKKRVITINCALDDARVPDVVVAQVLHHEMLHLYYGFSEGPKGERRFHTPEFRQSEKIFPGYTQTLKWIEDTWPMRGRPAKRSRPSENGFLAYLALMYP